MTPARDSWSTLTLLVDPAIEDDLDSLLAVAAAKADVALHGAAQLGTDPATGRDLWTIYLDTDPERDALEQSLPAAAHSLGWTPEQTPAVSSRGIQLREPWHEAWREHFQPVDIDGRLRILPPWLKSDATSAAPAAPIEILIEPGMAFGTGTHATTQLILSMMADPAFSAGQPYPAAVLDVGTGSAILAIAALRLGAQRITATDLDPDVAANVVDNLRLNGLLDTGPDAPDPAAARRLLDDHPRLRLHLGPLNDGALGPGLATLPAPWSGPFDLVLCNMLQHEFTPLLPALAALMRPGARLLLSGFLLRDADEVLECLAAAGLRAAGPPREQLEWGGLECVGA